MQNNRKMQISTAGSRKSTNWPRCEIMWSEFTEKLKTPIRGTETLEQYLALPKARQDDLKDVGGFVGGTFTGDRRKPECAEGRDLLTLDLAACGRSRVCCGCLQYPETCWVLSQASRDRTDGPDNHGRRIRACGAETGVTDRDRVL